MPFVTEELWQQVAAIEGIGTGVHEPHSIMWQSYPRRDKSKTDREAEKRMELLQNVVQAVRNIRAEMGVPPQAEAEVLVKGHNDVLSILDEHFNIIKTSARISGLAQTRTKPSHAASAVVGDIEVFVPLEDLIDLDVERARLDKEIARLEGMLKGIIKKLDNTSFLEKAPQDIVEREREKKTDLDQKLEKLRSSRASLN
jgi:valyl-tRNA synthetase